MRPALVLHCGRALGAATEALVQAAATVELLHVATLVHDDVIDDAELRRGAPTLKATLGNKLAILGGDYVLASSLRCAAKLGSSAVRELGDTVISVVEGELTQAAARGKLGLTLEHYVECIANKTGALFALSMRLASIAADAPHTIRALAGEFGSHLGIVFQMRDDYLDIFGSAQSLGKPIAKDLADGTPTLPLILAQLRQPHPEFARLFAERELGVEHLPVIRRWVMESGAEHEALCIMDDYAQKALAALECLPAGESRDALGACVEVALLRKH